MELTQQAQTAEFFEALNPNKLTQNRLDIFNQAKAALIKNGLPKLKEEEYKFTAITKTLDKAKVSLLPAEKFDISASLTQKEVIADLDADIIAFNNGVYDANLSSFSPSLNVNVEDGSTETASFKKHFGSYAKADKDAFIALNTVYAKEVVHVHLAKKEVLTKPVIFRYYQSNNQETSYPRVLITSEEFAEGAFIEQIISEEGSGYFINGLTEIYCAENTHLQYHKVQKQSKEAIEVNTLEVFQEKSSTFSSYLLSLQGGMLRNNLNITLNGSGGEANMNGLYLLNGQSHVDNHTSVDHREPHCNSNELYKGVLDDSSRGVFNGKIYVRRIAQKTNAFQQNNNILLSEDATINTKPQLEIWADDVKCSHGCTTGQLDEEALFYLQARGVGKVSARAMLLEAFAADVIANVSIDSLRNYMIDNIKERLGANY